MHAQDSDNLQQRFYKAGEYIFHEGDAASVAFIVESGAIEIEAVINGQLTCLVVLPVGEMFGELSLVDGSPRSASAKASTDAVLSVVAKQQIEERIRNADPILKLFLFKILSYFRAEAIRARGTTTPPEKPDPISNMLGNIVDSHIREEANNKLKLDTELRLALRDDAQIQVNYQPIIHLETQQIVGFEALARWCSPSRGWVSPGRFMQ
ncbi:MAG: cyclic nucleotide-binding domain-containing protein, partial [Cyanobacteria bacterium P01_H01_bin.121]